MPHAPGPHPKTIKAPGWGEGMGAAGGHPPYHCHAVPPRANSVPPPFSGVPWVLSTDSSAGRPEVVPLAQGPSSWAGAALPPPIRGTSRPGRSPSALQGSRCVPRPAGYRGASSSIVSVWAPRGRPLGAGPLPRAVVVPSVRGVPRVGRGPNAPPDPWRTSGPAGPRGSPTPAPPRGHPGAAPLT
ncbi:hypothetical protein NDU88_007737 [Pleurodeles waltl]|uniref:Uncharacterized protein n=1 Tax=Pleurodeles waltl TaxID=8319 RepID=A0AAV7NXF0_PLEWA|nr:hypothetical protein NDU88_007737 [Pleurodeles waltl]